MLAAVAAAAVAGCAKSSSDITGTYASPLLYQNLSCEQLGAEAVRVSQRVAQVSGVQDQKATSDAVTTGVAIVLFWPAAFMLNGNDQNAAELARLKGEYDAIQQANIQKSCGLQFQTQPVAAQQAAAQPKSTGWQSY